MTKSSYKSILQNKNFIRVSSATSKLKKYSILFAKNKLKKAPDFISWDSSLILLPSFLNKRIALHNGRSFSVFQVRPSMFLSRVGSLVRTKKLGSLIHVVKKKKKKK
jgi:ribosomal protein S19